MRTIVNKINNSKGRFFGLTTRDGRTFNAKYVKTTPCYIVIHDRNADTTVRLAQTNLKSVSGL